MQWLTYLDVVRTQERVNARSIYRALGLVGVRVSYQTVLHWLRPDASGAQMVPRHWRDFKALAEAPNIKVPESYLADLYRAILYGASATVWKGDALCGQCERRIWVGLTQSPWHALNENGDWLRENWFKAHVSSK